LLFITVFQGIWLGAEKNMAQLSLFYESQGTDMNFSAPDERDTEMGDLVSKNPLSFQNQPR